MVERVGQMGLHGIIGFLRDTMSVHLLDAVFPFGKPLPPIIIAPAPRSLRDRQAPHGAGAPALGPLMRHPCSKVSKVDFCCLAWSIFDVWIM